MINPYPDEPHPDQEWEWKKFWVQKFFRPEQMLHAGQIEWIHQCWINTKTQWYDKQ